MSCKHSFKKGTVFHLLSCLCIFIFIFSTIICTPVQAAWDGSGDSTGGTGGTGGTGVTGNFQLTSSSVACVDGYRFSVFDADGNKVGHSVDIHFVKSSYSTYRTYKDNKKSHIELYADYLNYVQAVEEGTYTKADAVSLGEPSTENSEAAYVYYDDTLPSTPTDVEDWLTPDTASIIRENCNADECDPSTSYIICEPTFGAWLFGDVYTMTLAEYAVFQSSQYGWGVPTITSPVANTYSVIMRQLSGYFGRYLYAEEHYSVFPTVPVPEDAFKKDANGAASILFSSNPRYNAASDVLKHQMGMAIYTDITPSYILTIDPNGGTYNGNTLPVTQEVLRGGTVNIERPTRPGYAFTGWTVSNSSCTLSGSTYTQGTGPCTLTAQWKATSCNLDINGLLDGTVAENIAGYGTFDVYIDGNLVADDVTDFDEPVPDGVSYEISDIKPFPGKSYDGVYSGSLTGVASEQTEIVLEFSSVAYNLTVDPNGGSWQHEDTIYTASHSMSVKHGSTISINEPERAGYTFKGWMVSNPDCKMDGTQYTQGAGDCTITAIWEENTSLTDIIGYLRFISRDYFDTLEPDSKWRESPLKELLIGVLSQDLKNTSSAQQVWHFSSDEYEKVHEWCLEHDKGTATNQAFLDSFLGNRLPVLNDYGFCFEEYYSRTENGQKLSYVFFEDGSIKIYLDGVYYDYYNAGEFTYSYKLINDNPNGETYTVSEDGLTITIEGKEYIYEPGFSG